MRLTILAILVLGCGLAVLAAPAPINSPVAAKAVADQNAAKAIKAADEWTKLQDKLDQLAAQMVVATNSIAQVSDNNTRQALNKVQNEVETLQDIVRKLKRLIVDSVNIQSGP